MNIFIVVIVLIFIILLTALFIITRKVKQGKTEYVRENYAFKSVCLLIGLAADIIAFFAADWSPWSILAVLLKLNTPEPPAVSLITKLFAVVIFIICAAIVCHFHNNWNGEISRRQYRIDTYEMNDSGLIQDFTVFLSSLLIRNYELKKYQKFSDDIASEKNDITNELPWHIEFAKMYSIMSNQAHIDPDNDWHAHHHCYISSYADKHKIAVYCSITLPSADEVVQFVQYIHHLNPHYLSIIVAVKENPTDQKDFSIPYESLKIEYIFKNNALDALVDFGEYVRAIDILYHKPLFPEYQQKIDDIYVEPLCSIGNNSGKEPHELHAYVDEWLKEDGPRQLALLGDFGQGKTLFATYLTYHIIQNKEKRIPLLIPLRNKSPRNSKPREILSYFASQYRIDPAALEILNANGRLLLIFDGFDEMDLVGNDDIRKLHFKSLWKLVTPKSKVLITGRPNYFINPTELKSALSIESESRTLPYCEALYLRPFNHEQIMFALRNSEPSVQNGIKKIIDSQASVSFLDLISRPSHLFLVSQIWDKRELEKKYRNLTSAMIINEFLQDCFERQSAKIKDGPYFFLSPIEREYFMIGIAIKMYKMGITAISKDLLFNTVSELIDIFPERLSSGNSAFLNLRDGKSIRKFAGEDENSLYAIINDVRICGVLVNDYVNDGFAFAHKSFYDLLVAKYYLGKEVKFHDSAMIISQALSSVYNTRLRNDFVVRKLLAELIAAKININMGKISPEIKCRKIFDQCYRIITRSHFKSSPKKLFNQCMRNSPNMSGAIMKSPISRKELNRTMALFLLPLVLFTVVIVQELSLISSYKKEALMYYSTLPESYYTNSAAVSFHIDPAAAVYASAVLILLFVILLNHKRIKKKAEIVLLTWYYTCKDNQIPEKTIYSFFPAKLAAAFADYIEGHNLTKIQEQYAASHQKHPKEKYKEL